MLFASREAQDERRPSPRRECGTRIMTLFLAALTLLTTVAACVTVGVLGGYSLILAILYLFRPNREPKGPAPRLVASPNN